MFLAALIGAASIVFGSVLGLLPSAGAWARPFRTFAVVTATLLVGVHLLPEAVEGAGVYALLVFAGAALLAPAARVLAGMLLGGANRAEETDAASLGEGSTGHASPSIGDPSLGDPSHDSPNRDTSGHASSGHDSSGAGSAADSGLDLELGYAGLLVHKLGDGAALAAFAALPDGDGAWKVMLGIAAHSIPITSVVVLAFARHAGVRSAIWRAAWLVLATWVGIAATGAAPVEALVAWEPWIAAAVAGLLVHVVLHGTKATPCEGGADHDPPEEALGVSAWGKADVAAVVLGAGLILLWS